MTATLGPCPVCGAHGAPSPDDESRISCVQDGCDFVCARKYWSLMRRKMTREEAEKMREDVWWARRDMENAAIKSHGARYYAALNQYKAAMRVIVDALVGDKP